MGMDVAAKGLREFILYGKKVQGHIDDLYEEDVPPPANVGNNEGPLPGQFESTPSLVRQAPMPTEAGQSGATSRQQHVESYVDTSGFEAYFLP
jgi:hypothetical protein